jgi:hypothetical protein
MMAAPYPRKIFYQSKYDECQGKSVAVILQLRSAAENIVITGLIRNAVLRRWRVKGRWHDHRSRKPTPHTYLARADRFNAFGVLLRGRPPSQTGRSTEPGWSYRFLGCCGSASGLPHPP